MRFYREPPASSKTRRHETPRFSTASKQVGVAGACLDPASESIMLRTIFIALWLVALPAITMAQTRVDVDRHKDFSRYKTFTLELEPPIRADGVLDEHNTLAESRLREAVTREFLARGLEPSDVGADLTIRVSSRETERTVVQTGAWDPYPFGYRWAWHPRWGYRRVWGHWGLFGGDVWTRRYVEGSVLIDVIERDTGQLVYRAQVANEIGSDLDKHVTKMIDKAFKKFPVKENSSN
jgi:hypothetical protein